MQKKWLIIKCINLLPELVSLILTNFTKLYTIYTSKYIIKAKLINIGFKNLRKLDIITKHLYKLTSSNKSYVNIQNINAMQRAAVYKFSKLHHLTVSQIEKKLPINIGYNIHTGDIYSAPFVCKRCYGSGNSYDNGCSCCYTEKTDCYKCGGYGYSKGYFLETLQVSK